MGSAGDRPLPSAAPAGSPADEAETEAEEEEAEREIDAEDARPRPPPARQSFMTTVYIFLFMIGLVMLFDTGTRYTVAQGFGYVLGPLIGFGGHYPLLTMFCAAAIEMILTAVAYNYTTDWVKAAKVQKWSAALRKVQMAAMRSGKKDRIQALSTHQQTLAKLTSEVTFAQLKGMAITWFLVIATYTWVYLYLANPTADPTVVHALCSPATTVNNCGTVLVPIGSASMNLLGTLVGPIQLWFLVFSLYTIPLSLIFRRLLKYYTLKRHPSLTAPPARPEGGAPA